MKLAALLERRRGAERQFGGSGGKAAARVSTSRAAAPAVRRRA